MEDINKAIIVGCLGADPEIKTSKSGKNYAKFSIGTIKEWKIDGEKKSETEWHQIVCYSETIVNKFIAPYTQPIIDKNLP